jgi:pyruvate formate lyase activating enzyme
MSRGFVHSIEVGSFVDGPGVRFVVFLSGCPLRCKYCHNPDAWSCRSGEAMTSEEVLARVARSSEFLAAGGGGVTVSGGEPLTQAAFAHDVLAGARRLGLHTALDTSGYLGDKLTDGMLGDIDLVLLDIKSFDEALYRDLTGVELAPTLRFAQRLSDLGKCMWVRFVLVPGLTDGHDNVVGLARFVGTLSSVERVEILPFHQMGRHKWEELRIPYALADTGPPTEESMAQVRALFEAEGLPVDEGRVGTCAPAGTRG